MWQNGGILLPLTCKIIYVNMQHDYVHMPIIYVNMQDKYVDMKILKKGKEKIK